MQEAIDAGQKPGTTAIIVKQPNMFCSRGFELHLLPCSDLAKLKDVAPQMWINLDVVVFTVAPDSMIPRSAAVWDGLVSSFGHDRVFVVGTRIDTLRRVRDRESFKSALQKGFASDYVQAETFLTSSQDVFGHRDFSPAAWRASGMQLLHEELLRYMAERRSRIRIARPLALLAKVLESRTAESEEAFLPRVRECLRAFRIAEVADLKARKKNA